MLDKTFTGTILKDEAKGGWTRIVWSEAAGFFGTGRAVKVSGTIDGHPFQATFLPLGDGTHMLPLKASLMALINKQHGETVEVHLTESR